MTRSRLSGRPLLGNRADADLFVGRTAELTLAGRAVHDRLNCVITGAQGSGRTSFSHLVLAELAEPHVLIRGGAATNAADLLRRIAVELSADSKPEEPEQAAIWRSSTDPAELIDDIRLLAERLDTVVIAIDDVPADAGFELFGWHRDELWNIPACWLVTVSASHRSSLLRPPADVFFEVIVDLPALTDTESMSLLCSRIDDAAAITAGGSEAAARDDALRGVVEVGAGNPRRLIELARQLSTAEPAAAAAGLETVRRREAALAGSSVPARMLAAELEYLGGASASDAVLLDRLGWTRARAVQVLKELEKVGLVTTTDERAGKGRPRKIYRLS
ncbi:MAG: helix-turn-helix transcriptional regulator [Actinomycetota bacterium]|nr:helix-turn-helix transcriptional regulator [Actinomycetota bacterium]